MNRETLNRFVVGGTRLRSRSESMLPRISKGLTSWIVAAASSLMFLGSVAASTVPAGFTESTISGPWGDAVGINFESNGRMYVWERTGFVWFQDPTDTSPTLLLNISQEVGAWED